MIKASILADSINRANNRITTFLLTYPRYIHAEFMTHRMFSRNSASSRAIPIERMIKDVQQQPAVPVFWGKNQKGMQSFEQITDPIQIQNSLGTWLYARDNACDSVEKLVDNDVHKQWANRLLEPWAHITVICTATEYSNWFKLRAHPAAMPDIQVLAYRMLDQYLAHTPAPAEDDYWHIPFRAYMDDAWTVETKLKVAVARCARVSYLNHDSTKPSLEDDMALFDRLRSGGHWSPFEHVAQAAPGSDFGNFKGWLQFRKQFGDEAGGSVDLHKILADKPDWVAML